MTLQMFGALADSYKGYMVRPFNPLSMSNVAATDKGAAAIADKAGYKLH